MTDEQIEQPLYYPTIDETYNIINRGHIATGHGGRDRMLKHLNQKYANITIEAAELYISSTSIELKVAEVGDNVAIPIPMVDKGRGDARNILGVVVDRDENDLYKIAVKAGILSTRYSRD